VAQVAGILDSAQAAERRSTALAAEKFRRLDLQLFADDGGSGGGSSGGGGFSAAYVQELRDEAASWRTKLRAAEAEVEKLKGEAATAATKITDLEGQSKTFLEEICIILGLDAQKVKPEEITAKIKEAASGSNVTVEKAQEALKKSAFIAAAVKRGIRKEALEDAYKLADFANVKVDLETMTVFPVDKDGNQVKEKDELVTGLDSLVDSMVKEKPYLAGKTGGVGSPSNPGGGATNEPEGFGAQLGKQQKELSKKHIESQSHYFPS
jgi:hypothetical protein